MAVSTSTSEKKSEIKLQSFHSVGSFWDKMFNGELEFNRFGIISFVLVVTACLGGFAVYFGALLQTFQLLLVVFPTMATLALILAVADLKWILNAGVTATIINLVIIVLNLIF